MTVYDLVDLFCNDEQLINLYSIYKDEVVWSGECADLPEEYEECMICSIDCVERGSDYLTINID